jgi:hypothetical protein
MCADGFKGISDTSVNGVMTIFDKKQCVFLSILHDRKYALQNLDRA